MAASTACLGLYVFKNPEKVIDFQIRFYRRINWEIKPIDMSREIKGTGRMGLITAVFSIAVFLFVVLRGAVSLC
jgi:hypothetical protein